MNNFSEIEGAHTAAAEARARVLLFCELSDLPQRIEFEREQESIRARGEKDEGNFSGGE